MVVEIVIWGGWDAGLHSAVAHSCHDLPVLHLGVGHSCSLMAERKHLEALHPRNWVAAPPCKSEVGLLCSSEGVRPCVAC